MRETTSRMKIPWSRRSIALVLLVFSVYLLLSPGHALTTPDEELNLRTTLSLIHGYRGAIPPLAGGFASRQGIDGLEYAQYGLGVPMAAAPWCLLGTWVSPQSLPDFATWVRTPLVTEADARFHLEAGEQLEFLRIWMTLWGMLVAAIGVAFFDSIVRRLGGSDRLALAGALLLAFCTYHWQHGRTFFTEPLVATCLLGAFWAYLHSQTDARPLRWLTLAGLFWAYALLTRVDTIFTLPAAAWLILMHAENGSLRLRIDARRIAAFAVPLLGAVLLIALYNQYRFDSFLATGYEDQTEGVRFATPVLVGLHGFLFTPGRSLFFYSPPVIFALWGIVALYRRNRTAATGVFLLIGVFLLAMSKWQNWAGGFDWGPRHIAQLTPFLMLLAVFGLDALRWQTSRGVRWLLYATVVLGAGMQLLGLMADPVQTIRDFLDRWPNESLGGGLTTQSVMMQFSVYLPQFSGPVQHAQAILQTGPSWLWLEVARSNPVHCAWMLVPLAGLIGSIVMVRRDQASR